jgi:hypothetical protein
VLGVGKPILFTVYGQILVVVINPDFLKLPFCFLAAEFPVTGRIVMAIVHNFTLVNKEN